MNCRPSATASGLTPRNQMFRWMQTRLRLMTLPKPFSTNPARESAVQVVSLTPHPPLFLDVFDAAAPLALVAGGFARLAWHELPGRVIRTRALALNARRPARKKSRRHSGRPLPGSPTPDAPPRVLRRRPESLPARRAPARSVSRHHRTNRTDQVRAVAPVMRLHPAPAPDGQAQRSLPVRHRAGPLRP